MCDHDFVEVSPGVHQCRHCGLTGNNIASGAHMTQPRACICPPGASHIPGCPAAPLTHKLFNRIRGGVECLKCGQTWGATRPSPNEHCQAAPSGTTAPAGFHIFFREVDRDAYTCGHCGYSVPGTVYRHGSFPFPPCGPQSSGGDGLMPAKTGKPCVCPMHGPNGLMARGCTCGAIGRAL